MTIDGDNIENLAVLIKKLREEGIVFSVHVYKDGSWQMTLNRLER